MSEQTLPMAKECPYFDTNIEGCPCTSADCPRKGTCCKCVAYHRARGNKPACMR